MLQSEVYHFKDQTVVLFFSLDTYSHGMPADQSDSSAKNRLWHEILHCTVCQIRIGKGILLSLQAHKISEC